MSERPTFASFDCYGTLIDWEGGLANFLHDFSLRHDVVPDENGDALRQRWEAIQFEIIQAPYRPYKEVLAESLRAWARERGLPFTPDDGAALVRAMRSWQPFPDTRPALAQARDAGLKLAILSNTDRDIIEHSLKHLEVPFDIVITAEDCGSYKPSSTNFERLLREIGLPANDVLHVAFGFKYDISPAQRAGMRSAWINRHIEPTPLDAKPDHTWRDLWGLPQLLGGPGPEIPS
jgi:2-haloalkanoic acid dehalogenase type II